MGVVPRPRRSTLHRGAMTKSAHLIPQSLPWRSPSPRPTSRRLNELPILPDLDAPHLNPSLGFYTIAQGHQIFLPPRVGGVPISPAFRGFASSLPNSPAALQFLRVPPKGWGLGVGFKKKKLIQKTGGGVEGNPSLWAKVAGSFRVQILLKLLPPSLCISRVQQPRPL